MSKRGRRKDLSSHGRSVGAGGFFLGTVPIFPKARRAPARLLWWGDR